MKISSSLIIFAVLMNGCGSMKDWTVTNGQHAQHIETQLVKTIAYDLLVYTPKTFGEEKKNWPLIIFLHGSGERGNDPNKLKVHSLPKVVEHDENFPFIVVSPQCPEGERWNAESLNAMLKEVLKQLPVDTNRIYLTGLSMGGYGVWKFAIAYPQWFAAIAPVCGWGHLEDVEKLKQMPVWIFHGAKDDVV
ncbi:MAG: phospholipase, partial [Bacteroidota bacterium]